MLRTTLIIIISLGIFLWFWMLIVYLGTKVPALPSSKKVHDLLRKNLPQKKNLTFVDLGCGDGRILFRLAKHHPTWKFIGYEISLPSYILARIRLFFSSNSNRIEIRFQNFFKADLKEADIVFAYLIKEAMPAVTKKLEQSLRSGAWAVTYAFSLQGWSEERKIPVGRLKAAFLTLYRKN